MTLQLRSKGSKGSRLFHHDDEHEMSGHRRTVDVTDPSLTPHELNFSFSLEI